jgi:hypothetical protein
MKVSVLSFTRPFIAASRVSADQAGDFISRTNSGSLAAILFTGDLGAAPGWMRALSVSNRSVAFATML